MSDAVQAEEHIFIWILSRFHNLVYRSFSGREWVGLHIFRDISGHLYGLCSGLW
jgi:hypothetical protein